MGQDVVVGLDVPQSCMRKGKGVSVGGRPERFPGMFVGIEDEGEHDRVEVP
jgi:hypothetical protein